jgi:hypothetical protein
MGGLKEDIKHESFLRYPTKIMESMQFNHHIQATNKDTHKSTIGTYTRRRDHFGVHKRRISQPTRLQPQQMDERRENGLFFNCERKYSKGHKGGENKLFYIDCEEEEYQEWNCHKIQIYKRLLQ